MARIRTIKPEFWSDDRVGECSVSARLLLIASLNFADDYGGLDRSSKQLKAQAFPYDSIDCEPLVAELLRAGLFIEYEASEKLYLHIKNFRKHQKVEKPAKPRIPPYEEGMSKPRVLTEPSPTPPHGVEVSSSEGKGMEGNGSRERMGSRTRPGRSPPRKRCPAEFEITPDLRDWAKAKAPDVDVDRETERFRDWEFKHGRTDWPATWRTWMARAQETIASRPTFGRAVGLTRRPKSADELDAEYEASRAAQ